MLLVLLIVLLIQLPPIQEYITQRATDYLEDKTGTTIDIKGIYFSLPYDLEVREIYVEDEQKDTLLYANRIAVDVDLLALADQQIDVRRLILDQTTAHIYRHPSDSNFNFSFFPAAFAQDAQKTETQNDQEKAEDGSANQGDQSWEIALDRIDLSDIIFSFKDSLSGNVLDLQLATLNLKMDRINLDSLDFIVDEIDLENTDVLFAITKFTPPDTTQAEDTSAVSLNLGINNINLEDIALQFQNQFLHQEMEVDVGNLQLENRLFSLRDQEIMVENLLIENSSYALVTKKMSREDSLYIARMEQKYEENEEEEAEPWKITADKVILQNDRVRLEDHNQKKAKEGIDFNHLLVDEIVLELNDLNYNGLDIQGMINQFTFKEQSGFALKDFQADFSLDSSRAYLDQLYVQTNNSTIQDYLSLTYPGFDQIANPEKVKLDLNISNSNISFRDILYFAPDLAETQPFAGNSQLNLLVNAQLKGNVKNLQVNQLTFQTLDSTRFSMTGELSNLMRPDQLSADIDQYFTTTQNNLQQLLQIDTFAFEIPGAVELTTQVQGSMDQLAGKVDINTSLGDISSEISTFAEESYQGIIKVDSFFLGNFLAQDTTMGAISLQAEIDGQGFNFDSLQADVDLIVERFEYNKYTYEGLTLDGSLEQQIFLGKVAYKDHNLDFTFDGELSLDPENPKYQFELDLEGIDLEDLQLSKQSIAASASLTADITGNNLNNINGTLGLREVTIAKEGATFQLDSLLVVSINESENTDIQIKSDFLDANFTGTINIGDLVPTLMQFFNQYYDSTALQANNAKDQNFEFNIDLKNPEILTEVLVPQLESLIPGYIQGDFDSENDQLNINMLVPYIEYAGFELDTMTFFVSSDQSQVNYALSTASIMQGPYELENFAIVGQLSNGGLESRLQITDQESSVQYAMGGTFTNYEDGGTQFNLDTTELILNYDQWQVADSSFLIISTFPVFVNNFKIQRNNEMIYARTEAVQASDSLLRVSFANFDLVTLSNLLEEDIPLIRGMLEGDFELNMQDMGLNADLNINDFSLLGSLVGNIGIDAEKEGADRYNFTAQIEGNDNDIQLDGYYLASQNTPDLNLELSVENFNLETLSGPLRGTLSEPVGSLQGDLTVGGNFNNLDVDGALRFNQAEFTIDYLGVPFTLENEEIVFNDQGIQMPNFQLRDQNGNVAGLNGYIRTEGYQDFNLDLNVSMNDFMALNTDAEENEMYYGKVVIDNTMSITGSINQPQVSMELVVEEYTDLTYIIPEGEVSALDREGLIEFVDRDRQINDIIQSAIEEVQDTATAQLTGMSLSANTVIQEGVKLRIVIDNVTGDYLQLTASRSPLSLEINPLGNINLSGVFEVKSGFYQLQFYEIVNRKFEIEQGSTIQWSGSPMDANINITASYTVEASPPPEVVTNTTEGVMIQVLLNMTGDLMRPDISFDLRTAPEAEGQLASQVSNYISTEYGQNENELNKQVFGLLVLQRFIGSNVLGGGSGISASARSSVSDFLSRQLNNLSAQLEGITISFDLESYEAQGQGRTDLEVALSKQLFNDRIRIKVGSDFNLEGENVRTQDTEGSQNAFTQFLGDILVEYRITEDGRYRVEFFRNEDYESLLQQNTTETGVGLIFQRDYNNVEELFQKPDEEDE